MAPATSTSGVEPIKICQEGGSGVVFPLFGDDEQKWPEWLRIPLYFIGLMWCFMGVAIIAEVFMGAIEKVTSRKIRRRNKKTGRWYTFEVWNATVANLTLMALGSSAPEILLNVIDIFSKRFFLEGLGPGTIVGSAAFNLLLIIAVCVVCIPDGQVRLIKEVWVYATTATWSVFAYVWLLIILLWSSPNVVEVWEGVLTFLFFPTFVLNAWLVDKGYFGGKPEETINQRAWLIHEDMTQEELAEAEARVRKKHGEHLTSEQIARIITVTNAPPRSRAAYRVGATRKLFAGRRLSLPPMRGSVTGTLSFLGNRKKVVPIEELEKEEDEITKTACYFEFFVEKYAVLENAGEVEVKVVRYGDEGIAAKVYFTTLEGKAKEVKDFTKKEGWLEFNAGEMEKTIKIDIIDDAAYEDDEEFYIELSSPQVMTCGEQAKVELGERFLATVTIIDDDDAGILCFPRDTITIYQKDEGFTAPILVERRNGSCGEVRLQYRVEGDTAIPGRDFEECSGELVFDAKQIEAYINVNILNVPRYEQADRFRVIISEPSGGAKLDHAKDGGPDKNILTVVIEADASAKERLDRVRSILQTKWDRSKVGHANWVSQFKDAIFVNGGDDDSDEGASIPDKIMHFIVLPWKLLFALVPPTDFCGGWLCFFFSLVMIGLLTMIIGDIASLLGCVICSPDEVTAITLVALGTSLPDTFASRTAAMQDPYADNSVGNVTGSNSVNVFLGLGLPWMIASIQWTIVGRTAEWDDRYQYMADLDFLGEPGQRTIGFVVPAGTLAFSVGIFAFCAGCCLTILYLRRRFLGGELGGPKVFKWITAGVLTFLWMVYILASSWNALSNSDGCPGR